MTAELPAAARLALGRATMPPATALALGEVAGPVLLVVERGTVDLVTRGEGAWIQDGPRRANRAVAAELLGVGVGALLPPGTAATLRAAGDEPAVVLIVAITPGSAPG
jgi:hypothetical protein